MMPAACADHALRHIKHAHDDVPGVGDDEDGAADLNIHLKNIQVSTSCRLFLSVMIWISSSVITIARITPAMGTMTVSERLWIMLKMLAVPALRGHAHLAGDVCHLLVHGIEHPGQVAHDAAYQQFLEPVRRASRKKSIRCQPPFSRPRLGAGAARISYDSLTTGAIRR